MRIRRRAGLDGVRLHSLRYFYASFLVNHGVSLYVVQRLLGHIEVRTTQRYAHLSRETMQEAAEVAGWLVEQATKDRLGAVAERINPCSAVASGALKVEGNPPAQAMPRSEDPVHACERPKTLLGPAT